MKATDDNKTSANAERLERRIDVLQEKQKQKTHENKRRFKAEAKEELFGVL